MPLIECPDCHKQVSDAAATCPQCGRPMNAIAASAPSPPTPGHVCIHCGSTNLSYADEKQGFGAGKAVVGALMFGPLGLLGGAIGSRKRHVHVRCNACLKTFTADKMLAHEKSQKSFRVSAATGGLILLAAVGIVLVVAYVLVR